ncbi:MAG: molybdopterin molybdotransferase MoeA, partial [Desulfobacteraceae bacterium]|nr:molybdopterin molybdotransferase MoeA [Desulfobacteraceae bacterium]
MDLNEAKKLSAELASTLDTEEVALQRALGRVLAADLRSGRDIPGESRSKWDGFAFSSRDSLGAGEANPACLDLLPGDVVAGRESPADAVRGACYRIMTGAVLPRGADAVIRLEDARLREGRLCLEEPLAGGSGVVLAGSDARRGEIMLEKGDILTPTRIAIAAATGRGIVEVVRRPRVGVLATGSELVDAGLLAEGPVIFGNNVQLLASLVEVAGGEPELLGIVPDDPCIIASRLESTGADLVLTTGGMGKGSKDFMPVAWRKLGIEVRFDS